MATLQIEVQDSKFISTNGVNLTSFTNNEVKGNGWEATIDENGKIVCWYTKFYSGIPHCLKFKIDKGYVKLILKIGKDRPKVLKSYRLEKWPAEGIIGLPYGVVDDVRPYFRNEKFKKFLNENGFTAVRCQPVNDIYQLMQEHNGHVNVFYESIETDGDEKIISHHIEINEQSRDKAFIAKQMIEVTNATWVIKTVWRCGEIKHRILYTLEDPKEIVGLPNIK